MYISEINQGIVFRKFGGFFSDNDFSMQCISRRLVVNRNTMFAFSCPVAGTNKGGMKYDIKKKEEAANLFISVWGNNIVSKRYNHNNEFVGLLIRWKKINASQQFINI
jgi:hypothetical protein